MIAELVGDGFGDERTLRRHIADWVEQVKEAYPGDTRKQIAVGKGIMQRLSRTEGTGREERVKDSIMESLKLFFQELHRAHGGRWTNEAMTLSHAVALAIGQGPASETAIHDTIGIPVGHIKEGRFGDFLANNVDWALSRERFWGTPLNIWTCEACEDRIAPKSADEILALNPEAFDAFKAAQAADPSLSDHLMVHKPWIDDVTVPCERCGGVMRRVPEVIDCWFCLLYTSPSPRDQRGSRMPSSA